MSDVETDEYGRCFCKKHHRETCHDCCFDFESLNQTAAENAGLIRKRSDIEMLAEETAQAMYEIRNMDRMIPRPGEEDFVQSRKRYNDLHSKLQKLRGGSEDVDAAMKKAIEIEKRKEIEERALFQAWRKQNPGKKVMEYGGPETQKLFDKFAATPNREGDGRVDLFTCSYCHKVSAEKLKNCSKCKKVVYCDRECQTKAWKAHKKVCTQSGDEKVKSAKLTWDGLEALQGQTAVGKTLEVRVILDESFMRQIVQCKDRNGVVKRVAAYTESRSIPGLKPGCVLRWKNPHFHYFNDGSSGARIEDSDLGNIKVSD